MPTTPCITTTERELISLLLNLWESGYGNIEDLRLSRYDGIPYISRIRALTASINTYIPYSIMSSVVSLPEVAVHLQTCANCDSLGLTWEQYESEDGRLCEQCCENYTYDRTREIYVGPEVDLHEIHEYHEVGRGNILKDLDLTQNLLGIELELYVPDPDDILSSPDHYPMIMERDGSLDDECGVEFVLRPATLEALATDKGLKRWTDLLKKANAKGWRQHNYGMHISLNAANLTDLHCCKIIKFINKNSDFCSKFAGREPNSSYYDYTCFDSWKDIAKRYTKYNAAARRSKERIEVRIFQSSRSYDRIMANCQFVDAVRAFTLLRPVKDITVDHFHRFIRLDNNRKRYKQLIERI